MKKSIFSIIALGLLTLFAISCGENEDVSVAHVLTDDEIEEIRRQDSIKNPQMSQINADLILEYTVELTASTVNASPVPLYIETDKIAELFGLTEEEVLAGIAGEAGAPEIKGFAIEGSTHADNLTSSNTNGPWGHWWSAAGDVTNWDYDTSKTGIVYSEWSADEGFFNVGQYAGLLTAGQTIEVIEGLKYGELRVAVVITINVAGLEEITATVVSTQQLTLDVNPASTYDMVNVKFDPNQVMSDLGISSMDDIEKFVAVKADGSYAQESDAGTNGYWYDADGTANGYSENSRVYTSYGGDEWPVDEIGIGQYPGNCAVGDSYTVKYGFLANNKIAMMEITVNIVAYQDPETAPEGEPEELTIDVNLQKNYTNDFANVQVDVRETLRQAFKMTTYQIHSARVANELKIYCQTETAEEPEYTADVPGYWLAADGASAAYADGLCWVSLGTSETELYLYGGNHPENVSPTAGTTLTTTYIITCNGGKVTVNITFQVDPEAAE